MIGVVRFLENIYRNILINNSERQGRVSVLLKGGIVTVPVKPRKVPKLTRKRRIMRSQSAPVEPAI